MLYAVPVGNVIVARSKLSVQDVEVGVVKVIVLAEVS
jgi:hypothetical protein